MPFIQLSERNILDQVYGSLIGCVRTTIAAAATGQTTINVGSVATAGASGQWDLVPANNSVVLIATPGSGATQNTMTAPHAFLVTGTSNGSGTATATIASQSIGLAVTAGDFIYLLGTQSAGLTPGFPLYNTFYAGLAAIGGQTTIAAGSDLATLPQATISVASTTGFSATGNLIIVTESGEQNVAYTGTSGGNSFTGCTGGTGKLDTGNTVYQVPTAAVILAAEATGGSYARVSYVNTPANFTAATSSYPASKTTGTTITFAQSTASWGATAFNVLFFADASTLAGGNVIAWSYLTTPQLVTAANITPSVASGQYTHTLL